MDTITRDDIIQQISSLKYRYLRALDAHDWTNFATCFTEHATASYSDGALSFNGKSEITRGITESMEAPFMVSCHQVHHPEFNIISTERAEASWYLQDYVICEEENWILQGAAYYFDKYVNSGNGWLYEHIGYERAFETRTPIPAGFRFTERASYLTP
jgi:hypothetical protein